MVFVKVIYSISINFFLLNILLILNYKRFVLTLRGYELEKIDDCEQWKNVKSSYYPDPSQSFK